MRFFACLYRCRRRHHAKMGYNNDPNGMKILFFLSFSLIHFHGSHVDVKTNNQIDRLILNSGMMGGEP